MSFLDKAKDLLNQHDDKVDQAIGKAGESAKGRFQGQEGLIDGAVGQARQHTGAGDTTQAPPPPAPPADQAAPPADQAAPPVDAPPAPAPTDAPPPAPPQQ